VGLIGALETIGHKIVAQHEILQDDAAAPGLAPRAHYLEAVASACARLADTTELCLRAGRFPLILGGDHSLSIGSVAGLVRYFRPLGKELGVLWVDAHTDMNTPETSPTGNLHGMPLAVLLGHGLDALTHLSGGPPALAPKNVVIFGVRDVDPEEELLVQQSGVRVFRRTEIAQRGVDNCLAEALERLRGAGAGIHLSFDLDVCDPTLAPGVTTPVHQGLDRDEALKICECLGRSGWLSSAEFVELNPDADDQNRTRDLAASLVESTLATEPLVEPVTRTDHVLADYRFTPKGEAGRRAGILAHSLYREMKAQGFVAGEIIGFASALLDELISHSKKPSERPMNYR
jgi:arginase